jgi:hypothetical protein
MKNFVLTYNGTREFDTWWELIEFIRDLSLIDSIAHNDNDLYIYRYPIYYGDEIHDYRESIYKRDIFCYDPDGVMINLSEIRDAIKLCRTKNYDHYKYVSWKWRRGESLFIRYRYDPVPLTGNRGGYRSRSKKTY